MSTLQHLGLLILDDRSPALTSRLACRPVGPSSFSQTGDKPVLQNTAPHTPHQNAVIKPIGNVTSAGWQVTLCDPLWHVSSRSGELLYPVTYLLTYLLIDAWRAG